MAGQRIENMDAFDLVIEQRQPHRGFRIFRRKDIEHVAAHPEHAAPEFQLVAFILHRGQALDRIALRKLFLSCRCRIMP